MQQASSRRLALSWYSEPQHAPKRAHGDSHIASAAPSQVLASPPPSVHMLRTTDELHAFVPQWTALWQSDPNRTPFQHPAWLLPWWHHFGTPELCAVVLQREDNLLALLPFYLYVEPDTGRRKLLLLGAGTSDYLDGVFAPGCTVEEVRAGLEHLIAEQTYDTLDTMQLRSESLLARALQVLGAQQGDAEPTSVLPAVALADLPTKIRRNAMYYRNRAERDATLELRFSTGATATQGFDTLVRLHGQRWQERGESGVLDDPAVLAWHREALPLLAAAGLLRLASLTRNRGASAHDSADEPLGLMYALADDAAKADRTLYLYLPAFSLTHRDLRPGTVLLALLIDAAARDGFTTIDMLRGGESYKQLWHVQTRGTLALSLQP